MSYDRHDDAVRTGIRRVAVTSVDDSYSSTDASGQVITQQLVTGSGYEGDSPTGMVRVQGHGFWSNPPVGSEGLALSLGGRSDRLHVVGLEHQDHKPTNLAPGDTAWGNDPTRVMYKATGEDHTLDLPGTHTITCKSLVIKCGGVTFTFDANGLAITGGKITHDGHDIGKTHMHTNAGGSGLSGPPQ